MEVTIQFPEEVGREVVRLPDRDGFVTEAVTRALKARALDNRPRSPQAATRWKRLVDRVSRDPEQLGEYYPEFRKQMREFRESFQFKHDRTP